MAARDGERRCKDRCMSCIVDVHRHTSDGESVYACVCAFVCVCVSVVWNKALAQRISNGEFKLLAILQGTESRVATFLAETCVMGPRR